MNPAKGSPKPLWTDDVSTGIQKPAPHPGVNSGVIQGGGEITSADIDGTPELRKKILAKEVESILDSAWKGLRDGCSDKDKMWVIGHIEAFHAIKVLTEQEYKRWIFAVEHCPGHDDEGGRVWCAYCGNIPQEKTDERTPGTD